MLVDVDKPELKLIDRKAGLGTAGRWAVPDEAVPTSNGLLPGESDFGTATEKKAITRETLNILSDLVRLKSPPLVG